MANDPEASTSPDNTSSAIAALEQRIASLEQTVQTQSQEIDQIRARNELLQKVLDHVPYAIYWKNSDLVYQGCNRQFATDLDLETTSAIVGKTDADLGWQPGEAATFEAAERRILTSRRREYDDKETVIFPDGTQEWFETYKVPLIDDHGNAWGLVSTYNNITARKQAEATVFAQSVLLEELSTPAIPLTDDILVVPVVGAMDSRRAQNLFETVLHQIGKNQAQLVVVDITGVPIIDTQVAQRILQMGQAVRLLGAQLVLTGIRPEVAQALVGLGIDLQTIITYSTLQSGIAEITQRAIADKWQNKKR